MLAWAARALGGAFGRLCAAAAIASGLLVSISYVGADLLHNVLLTQLQLWRVLWIAHVLASATIPMMVLRAWPSGTNGRLLSLSLAGATLAVYSRWPSCWVFLLVFVAVLAGRGRGAALTLRTTSWLLRFAWLAVATLSAALVAWNLDLLASTSDATGPKEVVLALASVPTLSIPLAALVLASLSPPGAEPVSTAIQRWRWAAAGLLAATLVLGALHWDRRPVMIRSIENGLAAPHPFQAHLRQASQVLWWGHPAATWVLLKSPSYWSTAQSSGMPFNRANAIESERRRHVLDAIGMQESICQVTRSLGDAGSGNVSDCMPTLEVLQRTCRSEPRLDFMVFERKLDGAIAEWVVNPESAKPLTWHLYDCARLR